MKRKNKITILFFNLLFLFYTTIGPVKALCNYLYNSSDSNLEHIVKTRLSKKYIQHVSVNVSKAKTKSEFSFSDLLFCQIDKKLKTLDNKIIARITFLGMLFSNVPLHIFHCSFQL
jgi:hypothetical protein